VTIRVSDRDASERFYRTVLSTLGIEQTDEVDDFVEWDEFSIIGDEPVTRGLHIGFAAASHEEVDAFWRAGTDAGYRDDGTPGPRPQYVSDYYGAFLLDPDGNSVEAVHHEGVLTGRVDHLWVRVGNVEASQRFYETIAPFARLRSTKVSPERVRFNGEGGPGSFTVLSGDDVTEDLHLAFAAPDDATVDDFHRAAIAAGYRDNGTPGERRVYHPGYYSAYVLDPDGNNVELVNHNR
jgi:catechol 2,3-dioxygenase-like lactoylglutathione lyase family enzyme